jgi:hypothetical protein
MFHDGHHGHSMMESYHKGHTFALNAMHLLQIARMMLPGGSALRINIDATRKGNVARFLNHRYIANIVITSTRC